MAFKLEFEELLKKNPITDNDRKDLISLFEFAQYLFDNDDNLTKTLNLNKSAKEKLKQRMEETFGFDLRSKSGENLIWS